MAVPRDVVGRTCRPIDATMLFRLLAEALDFGPVDPTAEEIINVAFPHDLLAHKYRFRDAYLLKEVLRKYPGFDLGIDRHQAAIDSLLEQESINSETNDRISDRDFSGTSPLVRQVLYSAGRKIGHVLGRFNPEEFSAGLRFGPRATSRIRGESPNLVRKLSGRPHCTGRAIELMYHCLTSMPQWVYNVSSKIDKENLIELHEYDTVNSVPKNAKTDRTVAPQPDLNGLGQLSVGTMIRRRLFDVGVNLNDQSINQIASYRASLFGKDATIDLRNASNSVSVGLVEFFFIDSGVVIDPLWYKVLHALRTDIGLIDGVFHPYELWSSMGNGYTFELESLIFWALADSVCSVLGVPSDISVYGDDLVVPTCTVGLLREVFEWCGFAFNEDKTFVNTVGPFFRESCGKHYLDGTDVTPFYVDQELNTPDQIVLLANNILRWSHHVWGRDGRMEKVYRWVVSHLRGPALDSAIPLGEANDGLIKDFDEACPSLASNWGTPIGYRARTYSLASREQPVSDEKALLIWHYLASVRKFTPPDGSPLQKMWGGIVKASQDPYRRYRMPSAKISMKRSTRVVTSWPWIGPWVK